MRLYKKLSKVLALVLFLNLFSGFSVTAEENNVLEISAPSAILIEQSTGEVLYEKNPDEKLALASVTKVMTMLLVMEAIDSGKISFNDIVTGSENAKSMGGSTIFLDAGEQMSVYDLMKGVAVASGNDAAVALAEYVSGSEEGFVSLMNERAKELGMVNTQFKNPNGLDEEGHYSSARDISIMSRELLKHEKIFEFTTIWMDSLRNGAFELSNTNKLIRFYEGANGLKTGSTSIAKNCISASAKRNNMQLIAVVMKAETSANRFEDAKKLLNYGFSNYEIFPALKAGDTAGEIMINKGDKEKIFGVIKDNFNVLTKKGDTGDIKLINDLKTSLDAPIKKGSEVGKAKILKGDKLLGEVSIISDSEAKKLTYYAIFGNLFSKLVNF